jgi:hypothetical protein
MKKISAILLVLVVLLIAVWAAGPFITVKAIRTAIKEQDSAALARQVDFPELRRNLRAQTDDYLARQAGPDAQSGPLGALAMRLASEVAGGAVDAIATPAGIGALLQGRSLFHRISGGGIGSDDPYANQPPRDPFENANYRFEGLSTFTATLENDEGRPVVMVMRRQGLRWRVTDIRLPIGELIR